MEMKIRWETQMIDDMDLKDKGSWDAHSEASQRNVASWMKTPPCKRAHRESDTSAGPRKAGKSSRREIEEGASWLKIAKEWQSLKEYVKAQTHCRHLAKGWCRYGEQ